MPNRILGALRSLLAALARLTAAAALASMMLSGGTIAESATPQAGEKRLALVIADGNYPDANQPFQSAVKDSDAFAKELTADGFDVDYRKNLTRKDMQSAIDALLARITPGATVLFYFNGIGIQSGRQSYLVPIDARIWKETDVSHESLSLSTVVADMNKRGAAVKIVVVDASRRNPFERRFRPYTAGLAGVDAPEGTLIMYAAMPNKMGPDDSGDVSIFMQQLLKELGGPDVNAEDAMMRTRIGVSRASNGEQVPWISSSLADPFYLRPKVSAARGAVSTPSAANADAPAVRPSPAATLAGPAPVARKVSQEPFQDCKDCPTMLAIPAGSFRMGADATAVDRPVHTVTIARPFAMSRTEVTIDAWNLCAADGACTPETAGVGEGTHPATNVSWSDAKAYVAWLSRKSGKAYRLPSEAEWEYAAHGGTTTAFPWGAAVGTRMANCLDCAGTASRKPMPVMSYAANGYRLYDMAGNAAEWVEDCWNESYRGAPRDGSAWTSGNCAQRVLRGGSFDSGSAYVRPSARFRYDADVRYWTNGFRVARDLP